jgi:hypothetical protein
MRKAFGKEELEATFKEIGKKLGKPTEVFLLGGGAMCFRNQKIATKDLDLVFEDAATFKSFFATIEKIGFKREKNLESEYEKMMAAGVWKDNGDFRFDLFVKTVCNALELSERIVGRSENLGEYGNLVVKMVSNEDVILFKGITERLDDVNDIAAIIRTSKIDWDIVFEECKLQSRKRAWYGLLYDKLIEIKEKHGIDAPIIKKLQELDNKVLLKEAYDLRIKKGLSNEEAIRELVKMGFTRKQIEKAIKD